MSRKVWPVLLLAESSYNMPLWPSFLSVAILSFTPIALLRLTGLTFNENLLDIRLITIGCAWLAQSKSWFLLAWLSFFYFFSFICFLFLSSYRLGWFITVFKNSKYRRPKFLVWFIGWLRFHFGFCSRSFDSTARRASTQ